jgi:putative membrane protein
MLGTWPIEPAVTLALVVSGALYVGADRRMRRTHGGRGLPPSRRRSFLSGLAVVFLALESPLDAAVATSFSMHMVQHLMLTMVAAPLLVSGAPVTLALASLPSESRRPLVAALRGRVVRVLSNPVLGWGLFFAVMWGTHFTGLYEASLHNGGVHAAEHLAYIAAGALFWMPIAGRDHLPTRLPHPARILYLFLAMPAMAFLGLAIYSADNVLYPAYAAAEGTARALSDQHAAGAIMWTGGMILILPALALVLLDWMKADDREARRIDERLLREARVKS